jgi:hypothetical protein
MHGLRHAEYPIAAIVRQPRARRTGQSVDVVHHGDHSIGAHEPRNDAGAKNCLGIAKVKLHDLWMEPGEESSHAEHSLQAGIVRLADDDVNPVRVE